jgi:hypothetical protein
VGQVKQRLIVCHQEAGRILQAVFDFGLEHERNMQQVGTGPAPYRLCLVPH